MAKLLRNMGRATKATHQVAAAKKMKKIAEASSKSKVNKSKAASVANKQTSSHRKSKTLAKGVAQGRQNDQENVDQDQELTGNEPSLEESETRSMDQGSNMSNQFSEMSSEELQRIESMLDKLSEMQFRQVMLKKLSTSFTEEEIKEDGGRNSSNAQRSRSQGMHQEASVERLLDHSVQDSGNNTQLGRSNGEPRPSTSKAREQEVLQEDSSELEGEQEQDIRDTFDLADYIPVTPINVAELENIVREYSNRETAIFLVQGFKEGFKISYKGERKSFQ